MKKFNIKVKGVNAGYLTIAPVPTMDTDVVEIVDIYMEPEYAGLKLAIDAVRLLFRKSSDINKIVISPEPQSMQFWYAVGFIELNNSYLIIMRGH